MLQDIAPFVCRELTRVRHTTVTTAVTAPGECPSVVNTRLESGSSASERADSLAALVFHLSRSQAQRLIEQEKVFADGTDLRERIWKIPLSGDGRDDAEGQTDRPV